MPVESPPAPPRPLSRRHRRVLWTASVLAVLVAAGAVLTYRVQKENEPAEYTPGEASRDITSVLSDKGARHLVPDASASRRQVTARRIDPLRDAGRPLPSGAPEPRFTDVTGEAGLDGFRQFQGPRTSQLPEDMGSGLAWGDYDNDGYEDLFAVSGGGALSLPAAQRAPSLLYRNLGNGRFEVVADFPETRILGMGAAWGDYDNDGWLDLVVTGYDVILLFRNDRGRFTRAASFPSPKGFWAGAAWGDFNHDGRLDLYVCGYVKYVPGKGDASSMSKQFGKEVPFTLNPASYDAERNLLFRNDGGGRFTEVARALGVADPAGRSLSALWHDFNDDGWPDLYVANDISENKLYLNRQGRFLDAGRAAWVEEYRGSMGLAAGDFDRDGDDDLFISHWVAQQYALYQNLSVEQQTSKSGQQDLHFTDVAPMAGIGQPSLQFIGWGASFGDFDADGWLDLAVANGSTFEEKTATPRQLVPMPSFLFWNARGKFLHDLAPWNQSLGAPRVSRGLAVADYDNDGALDIALIDHQAGLRLLRNDLPHGNWMSLRLHGRHFADGAVVKAWLGGTVLRRTASSASYLSQDSRRVHLGLGEATRVDRIEVRWPDGATETWTDPEANRIWDLSQGHPGAATPFQDKTTQLQFWEKQRQAMDALKRANDAANAARLFREALALNPAHEDSRYYLANALAARGDIPGAVAELDTLARINPQSHRAFQRKGELLAAAAQSRRQLEPARQALLAGLRLNSEETGSLVLLGQVTLAAGDLIEAERHFTHACQANARAVDAWFYRAYIAWTRGDAAQTAALLEKVREARGKEWKPAGAALEGDVKQRMFNESGFLNVFERQWDGQAPPQQAFGALQTYLRGLPR